MSALAEARRAVEVLEQHEHTTDPDERLTLSVRARGWLCLAANSLQPHAPEQTTVPLPALRNDLAAYIKAGYEAARNRLERLRKEP